MHVCFLHQVQTPQIIESLIDMQHTKIQIAFVRNLILPLESQHTLTIKIYQMLLLWQVVM